MRVRLWLKKRKLKNKIESFVLCLYKDQKTKGVSDKAQASPRAPRTKVFRAWYGARVYSAAAKNPPSGPKNADENKYMPKLLKKAGIIKTILMELIKEKPRRWKNSATV